MSKPDWSTPSARLKWAREHARFDSARAAAAALDVSSATYQSHEDGTRAKRGFPPELARRYARRFGVSLSWLMTGEGEPDQTRTDEGPVVKVAGHVGAGAVVIVDGSGDGWYRPVESPVDNPEAFEVYEVHGVSMLPYYAPDDLLFIERRLCNPRDMMGRPCLVVLDSGERFVKILKRGSASGLFDLESWNAVTMHDRRVVSVGRIAWHMSR